MRYLKPKIDTGKVLEDKPTQLPPDNRNFAKLPYYSWVIGSNY